MSDELNDIHYRDINIRPLRDMQPSGRGGQGMAHYPHKEAGNLLHRFCGERDIDFPEEFSARLIEAHQKLMQAALIDRAARSDIEQDVLKKTFSYLEKAQKEKTITEREPPDLSTVACELYGQGGKQMHPALPGLIRVALDLSASEYARLALEAGTLSSDIRNARTGEVTHIIKEASKKEIVQCITYDLLDPALLNFSSKDELKQFKKDFAPVLEKLSNPEWVQALHIDADAQAQILNAVKIFQEKLDTVNPEGAKQSKRAGRKKDEKIIEECRPYREKLRKCMDKIVGPRRKWTLWTLSKDMDIESDEVSSLLGLKYSNYPQNMGEAALSEYVAGLRQYPREGREKEAEAALEEFKNRFREFRDAIGQLKQSTGDARPVLRVITEGLRPSAAEKMMASPETTTVVMGNAVPVRENPELSPQDRNVGENGISPT